jgi:hypothetical protein
MRRHDLNTTAARPRLDLHVEEEPRPVELNLLPGTEADMGPGDEWPGLLEKIRAADILAISTPMTSDSRFRRRAARTGTARPCRAGISKTSTRCRK